MKQPIKLATKQIEIYVERDNFLGYYKIYKFNLVTRMVEQIGADTNLKKANALAVEKMAEFVKG